MAAFVALSLSACGDESFEAPPEPDLYKAPYDFAVPEMDGGLDQGMPDLKMSPDLRPPPDDLLTPTDS
jgi:hypothetical protein